MPRTSRVWGILIGVGIFAYFLGVCFCAASHSDKNLLKKGSDTPQQIPLTHLAIDGSPDNIHVNVTGFTAAMDRAVIRQNKDSSGAFVDADIPLFSADGSRTARPVVLQVWRVYRTELTAIGSQQPLIGLLAEVPTFEPQVHAQLAATFPDQKLCEAIVIKGSKKFPARGTVYTQLSVGTALLFVGLVCVWGGILRSRRDAMESHVEVGGIVGHSVGS